MSYMPNDQSQFGSMFREDAKFLSVADFVQEEDVGHFLRELYSKYYVKLFYVFQYYQSESVSYPGLS